MAGGRKVEVGVPAPKSRNKEGLAKGPPVVLGTGVSISDVFEELELLAESEVCQDGFGHRI